MSTNLPIDHLIMDPARRGGRPLIRGTRITVHDIAIDHARGRSVEQIGEAFDLTSGQVYAALSYYFDHQAQIDQENRGTATQTGELAQQGQAKSQDSGKRKPDLSPLRLLLLDREPDLLLAMGTLLEVCGAHVTTSPSAREAFDLINRKRFNLLISELALPVVDGFALIKAIRSHVDPVVSALPAIAMTGNDPRNKEAPALQAGYNRFFWKPIDFDDFLSCLEGYARQAAQH